MIEEKVVTAVEDGWVYFGDTKGATDTFRFTTETHLTVTGRKANVGDVHKFTVSINLEQKKHYLYDRDRTG